jgi:hypothetical protein
MENNIPQVPTGISQAPQQPPVDSQATPESTPPTEPKKGLKTKILIILIALVSLVTGGFFVYKNILQPGTEKRETEEEVSPIPVEVSKTTKTGKLERDEIWSGQIHITGDILVEEGVTLTILPGTQVIISANKDIQNLFGHWECDGIENYDSLVGIKEEDTYNCGVHKGEPYRDEANHISIIIRGTLKAIGTEESRIIFKSDSLHPTIYDWNRFDIHNGILSYANVENYRILETREDVEISHNNLKNIGECGICANSNKAKILSNNISYAGHELIDMHHSSPFINSNHLGPNPNRAGIIIDGGSPQITANKIEGCGYGISFISPPDQPIIEDNIFLNNQEDKVYGY